MRVCGLEVVANYCERDSFLNRSKSNRFVPWRVCPDEIGVVPVEQGDLCLFLDFNTHSWVLADFLGTWWFEQSILWGYAKTQPQSEESNRKRSETQSGVPHSEEWVKRQADSRRGKGWTQEMKDDLSRKKKGTKSPLKGVPMTEEQKEKLRGIPRTESQINAVRASNIRRGAQNKLCRMSINDPLLPNFDD